jgi:hypothetical protein
MRPEPRQILKWSAGLLALGATAWLACSLELGDAPFLCHDGTPECPEGYYCEPDGKHGVCVKEGSLPPKLDASQPQPEASAETGPGPEVGVDMPWPADMPVTPLDGPKIPGKVVITEFMANPYAGGKVPDTMGEWIELYNLGNTPVDINGWAIKDADSDNHMIQNGGPLIVPPKGYLLLGQTTDKALNGGVNVVYAYKSSELYIANANDEIFLLDNTGKQVDGFSYSTAGGFKIPTGASLSVKSPTADKSKAANWCAETTAWPGSLGDKGTPGTNPGC